ncbi:MAG: response regulator [Verrucomicrobiales bacterium]|nr:response regulator [Verrucomicrobiales bacterium]
MRFAAPAEADRARDADPEFLAAFADEDRRERLRIGKLGCALVILLMPLGFLLDMAVYPGDAPKFFGLRILCSAVTAVLLALHYTAWGRRHVFWLGLPIALLPAGFIGLMIAKNHGYLSPYYAGLNLVLIAVNVVARWSVAESLGITCGIILIYVAASLPEVTRASPVQWDHLINNFYFLGLTGVIVVAGNALYNQLRIREFTLRFQLNRNQQLLEENNRKLRELDEIKGRFFANISHELRTPLTLLLAPLEALRRPAAHLTEGEVADHLQTMHANGLRLLKLINDLLDLVRLESGRMEVRRESVALQEFVSGIANSARKLAEDRRLRLDIQVMENLGLMSVDRDKLEKAFLNLLINAIKFTPAGGTITCRASRSDTEAVLQVSDTGIGIPAESLPRVFDRFWQADASSQRKHQGVGIGLALVKELVEIQGGTVDVSSVVGQGTTFTLRLPWIEPKAGAPVVEVPLVETAPSSGGEAWLANLYRRAELFSGLSSLRDSIRQVETSAPGNRPRILIADDEPDMLRFLRSQLAPHFQVLEAVDGLQAIEKATQLLPDIILCDMMMPERDGLQVCRELRGRVGTRGLPVVLLTARADEETKIAGLEAGADDFLTKPFSTVELHIRLKNLVESHRLQRDLARQKQILESTIEELKETEMQLVQSEKMASLGRLSAGVIHEINNPLNYVKTGLVVLGRQGKQLPESGRSVFEGVIQDINEGVERVVRIVSDLRKFSHPGDGGVTEVRVAESIASALRFLAAEWRGNITVEEEVAPGFTIPASPDKLLQVFLNLIQNSIDSLTAKTFPEGEFPTLRIRAVEEAGRRWVSVWDNGNGIAPAHRDKIFDPFFTTKDVGEGTGLGLSLCYRMVTEWGGRILVNTEEGRYCEFRIEFATAGAAAESDSHQ